MHSWRRRWRKYYNDKKEEINKDIDSTAANWQAPSQDKGSNEWKKYSNNQDSLLDGSRHNFVSQDSGLNSNKGDDDDFDKLVVKGKYELKIQKTNKQGNAVSDVQFTIKKASKIRYK